MYKSGGTVFGSWVGKGIIAAAETPGAKSAATKLAFGAISITYSISSTFEKYYGPYILGNSENLMTGVYPPYTAYLIVNP